MLICKQYRDGNLGNHEHIVRETGQISAAGNIFLSERDGERSSYWWQRTELFGGGYFGTGGDGVGVYFRDWKGRPFAMVHIFIDRKGRILIILFAARYIKFRG